MLILHHTCEEPINSLIFDETILVHIEKMAIFEIPGGCSQLNFYPIGQEITGFGIQNALGKCLYYTSKEWTPYKRLNPLFLIIKSEKRS